MPPSTRAGTVAQAPRRRGRETFLESLIISMTLRHIGNGTDESKGTDDRGLESTRLRRPLETAARKERNQAPPSSFIDSRAGQCVIIQWIRTDYSRASRSANSLER